LKRNCVKVSSASLVRCYLPVNDQKQIVKPVVDKGFLSAGQITGNHRGIAK